MKPFFDNRTVVSGLAGSLCLIFGTAISAADETGGADAAPLTAGDEAGEHALTRAAKAFGWRVEELDDGSVILYPPAPTRNDAPAEAAAAPEASPVTVRDARHWRTTRLEDGSLILYQGDADSAPAAGAGAETLDEETAKRELAERGWGLRLEEDGTVEFHSLAIDSAKPAPGD